MNHRCRAHDVVTAIAIVAWVVVSVLIVFRPGANDELRLPFFAILGVAIVTSNQSLTPLVMRRHMQDVTLAYKAGREDEAEEREQEPPRLRALP